MDIQHYKNQLLTIGGRNSSIQYSINIDWSKNNTTSMDSRNHAILDNFQYYFNDLKYPDLEKEFEIIFIEKGNSNKNGEYNNELLKEQLIAKDVFDYKDIISYFEKKGEKDNE